VKERRDQFFFGLTGGWMQDEIQSQVRGQGSRRAFQEHNTDQGKTMSGRAVRNKGWSEDREWVDQGYRRVGGLGDNKNKNKRRVASGQ
jgi:hypothetical protein